MALGGHFEKLKLPKGDTSTPSGIFKQAVWAAVFCKEKTIYSKSKYTTMAAGLLVLIRSKDRTKLSREKIP